MYVNDSYLIAFVVFYTFICYCFCYYIKFIVTRHIDCLMIDNKRMICSIILNVSEYIISLTGIETMRGEVIVD